MTSSSDFIRNGTTNLSTTTTPICETIHREQVQSIRDLTSGHLNENHLYRVRDSHDGIRKACWSSSQKPCPTLRPAHRVETCSSNVEDMKNSLVNFTALSLPQISTKKAQKPMKIDEQVSSSSRNNQQLPPITKERIQVPTFSIDLSDEQKLHKMKAFGDSVLNTNDVNLHGLGYSEDFVAYVEQNLLLKLATIENQYKRQTVSLSRLQAYSEAMNQLIEGSLAFGPVLERIKNEYELYLDHLLTSQPDYGTHIAEQLKRLRQSQPNFSTADAELFDIEKIEEQTRQAIKRNQRLNEELKRVKEEQTRKKTEATVPIDDKPVVPKEMKIKTQAEQIDDMRQNIFDLLDRMERKRQELSEIFVPISVCTQIQQAVRDTEMDVLKTKKQNEALSGEIQILEDRIKQDILSHDQSEFAQENAERILQLLKKFDVLHMKRSIANEDDIDDQHFLHTYDDYFS